MNLVSNASVYGPLVRPQSPLLKYLDTSKMCALSVECLHSSVYCCYYYHLTAGKVIIICIPVYTAALTITCCNYHIKKKCGVFYLFLCPSASCRTWEEGKGSTIP